MKRANASRWMLLAAILVACGDPSTPGPASRSSPTDHARVTEADLVAADVVLFTGETEENLEVGGYGFEQATIGSPGPRLRARARQAITVGLKNVHGYLDDEEIDHDFAVVAEKSELSEPLWGSQTETLDPGEADVVTFSPAEPGRYFYICTLSGHLSAHGMWGRFVVE